MFDASAQQVSSTPFCFLNSLQEGELTLPSLWALVARWKSLTHTKLLVSTDLSEEEGSGLEQNSVERLTVSVNGFIQE